MNVVPKEEILLEMMEDINKLMIDKFKKRSFKHPEDDILNKNTKFEDFDLVESFTHLENEFNELKTEWALRRFRNMQDECIDLMNMCFKLHKSIELKFENSVFSSEKEKRSDPGG